MRRRTLLSVVGAGAGIGLAGCQTEAFTGTRTPTGPGDGTTVRIASVSPPTSVPLEYEVAVVSQATPRQPPELRTRIRNAGDSPYSLGDSRPAKNRGVVSEDGRVVLQHHIVDEEHSGDCWGLDDIHRGGFAFRSTELEAGAEIAAPTNVYGREGRTDGCLPSGAFTFRPDWNAESNPGEGGLNTNERLAVSFTLEIEADD